MRRVLTFLLAVALVACPMPCGAFGMECEIAGVECCAQASSCPIEGSCAPVPAGPLDEGIRLDAAKLSSPVQPDAVLPPGLPAAALRALESGGIRPPHVPPHVPRFLELQVFRL